MKLERKDWERVREEATMQLKQAAMMEQVNTLVLDTAEREISRIDEEAKSNSTTAA